MERRHVAHIGGYDALAAEAVEDTVGLDDGVGITGLVDDARRIDAGLEADRVGHTQNLAVPLTHGQRRRVAIDLHSGMRQQHVALPPDPAAACPGLAVGYALEEGSQRSCNRPKYVFRRRQCHRPDQMNTAGLAHGDNLCRFVSMIAPDYQRNSDGFVLLWSIKRATPSYSKH